MDAALYILGSAWTPLSISALTYVLWLWHTRMVAARDRLARAKIDEWANERGLTVLSCEMSAFGLPWVLKKSASQSVCRIEVRDPSGTCLRGWIRVGGFFFGLLSDRVEVRWDSSSREVTRM
jgi:hypothetical protein